MSILIKGTKMPETCEECQSTLGLFADECPLFAEFPKKFDYDPEIGNNRRYAGCPLVEIPSHGRLIDADALIKRATTVGETDDLWDYYPQTTQDFVDYVNDALTVIESEEE